MNVVAAGCVPSLSFCSHSLFSLPCCFSSFLAILTLLGSLKHTATQAKQCHVTRSNLSRDPIIPREQLQTSLKAHLPENHQTTTHVGECFSSTGLFGQIIRSNYKNEIKYAVKGACCHYNGVTDLFISKINTSRL